MAQDFHTEFLRGLQLALRGERAQAIEAFERSRRLNPLALGPALNLLESYREEGRMAEADALADEVLRLWPNEHDALFSVAKLREAQGRPGEALKLMRDPHADTTVESLAYPFYLRVLLENQLYDEALAEAEAAIRSHALWTPYAMLTRIIALLHFKEYDVMRRQLAEFDADDFADLVEDYAAGMKRAGALDPVRRFFADARTRLTFDERLEKLGARFDAAASPGSGG